MLLSIKTLLSSIVDYAGLFPPAKLNLQDAMRNYAQEQIASYHWMLGHFVLPSSRLNEFEMLLPQYTLPHWSLSLIISNNWQSDLEKVLSLDNSKITIAALEFPPLSSQEIETVLLNIPTGINTFFEIPFDEDLTPFLVVLKSTSASVKLRTGGIASNAFPTPTQLSQFIFSLAKAKVPFKATAGLHHPLRGEKPLTPATDSPLITMHGFLNLTILTALIYNQKVSSEEGINILQETEIDNFQFKNDGIFWRDRYLTLSEIEEARQQFFQSFGSCSFTEPIEDLKQLQLLN